MVFFSSFVCIAKIEVEPVWNENKIDFGGSSHKKCTENRVLFLESVILLLSGQKQTLTKLGHEIMNDQGTTLNNQAG